MMRYLLIFIFILISCKLFSNDTSDTIQDEFQIYYKKVHTEPNKKNALKYAFKALEIAKQKNNDSLIASGLIAVSQQYGLLGNLSSALNYALSAEPYINTIYKIDSYIMLNFYIATIYNQMKNHDLSIKYYKKSLRYDGNYPIIKIGAYLNIGDEFRKLNQLDSAIIYLNRSQEISDQLSIHDYYSFYLANMGLVLACKKMEAESDSLIKKSTELFISKKDYLALCQTYLELGKINYQYNNYDLALELANKAFEIADTSYFIVEIKESSELLANIYEIRGDFYKAYSFLKSYNALKEKISNDSVVSKLAEMRAEFEISQNETEMSYLKKKKAYKPHSLL